jgi:dTDP-glucose 4,6-dehydratase
MPRLLVTGGMGFIGSNFVRHLLDEHPDVDVINVDVLAYAGNPLNLADLEKNPRYRFFKGNICDRAFIDSLLGGNQNAGGAIDGIVHLAAESMVDRSIADSAPFVMSNVVGTQVLLDGALKHGIPRFVMVSTDEVYGEALDGATFDENAPLAPNNPYAASKAGADLLCRSYWRTHGLPVIVTRCSNNYGPRQFPEKLIPLMISKALNGESLPVYGDGQHIRDWLYVADHCRGLWAAYANGKPGEVYNFGSDRELTNLELVRQLLKLLGKSEELISYVPDRKGHDKRYSLSSAKARAELGWQPKVAFEDGLQRTAQWYRDNASWLQAVQQGKYQAGY